MMSQKEIEEYISFTRNTINQSRKKSVDGGYDSLLTSMSQVKEHAEALRDIPLTIILPDLSSEDPSVKKVLDERKKQTELSNKSKLILIDDSTVDVYSAAQTISEAIIEMIDKYKEAN